jgi:hypothetical protein
LSDFKGLTTNQRRFKVGQAKPEAPLIFESNQGVKGRFKILVRIKVKTLANLGKLLKRLGFSAPFFSCYWSGFMVE